MPLYYGVVSRATPPSAQTADRRCFGLEYCREYVLLHDMGRQVFIGRYTLVMISAIAVADQRVTESEVVYRTSRVWHPCRKSEVGNRQSAVLGVKRRGGATRGEAAQGWSMADPAFGVDRKSQLCSPGQSQARTHDDGRWNHIHTTVDVQPSMIDTIL